MSRAEGEMTLVFTLSALRRLADPGDSVADARGWTAHIGAVADDPEELTAFLAENGLNPDFVSGEGGVAGGLAAVRQRFPTDRHVLVGVGDDETAAALGWERLDVAEAAERADWELQAD